MIVIAKNAEDALFQELKKCYENNIPQRCVYLRLSETDEHQEIWFQPLSAALEDTCDGELTQLYICQDSDVFILLPGWTQKRLNKMTVHLATALGKDTLEPLASLFEVKIDWPKLKNLCDKKREAFKRAQDKIKQKEENEAQRKVREQIIANIDPQLKATLSVRRDTRDTAEIMIAEDDSLARMLIKNVLSPDFTLHVVENGLDAVTGFVENAPDLLFLDIGLPGMDGMEVLETIFQLDPDAYIIMFSGRKDKDTILHALEIGAQGFVSKPFTRDKLYQYIQLSPTIQDKKQHMA